MFKFRETHVRGVGASEKPGGQSWGKAEAGKGLRIWDPRLGRVPQELRTWRDLFMMAVSGRRLS